MTKQMTNEATRRAVVAGIAATPLAAIPAPAEHNKLAALISNWREKDSAFAVVHEELEATENAYREAGHPQISALNYITGDSYVVGGRLDLDRCESLIRAKYRSLCRSVGIIQWMEPEIYEQFEAALAAVEAVNLKHLARLAEEEKARQDAFGLTSIKERHEAALTAEKDAREAILAYRCTTLNEAKTKAAAILQTHLEEQIGDEAIIILQSFVDGASAPEREENAA